MNARIIAVEPIKKTTAEYKAADNVDITFLALRELQKDKLPGVQFNMVTTLLSDNRELFIKLFGEPSFYFRGEFLFHGRCFKFEDGIYWVLTAKTKGTCYEGTIGHEDRDVRFMQAMWDAIK